MVDVPELLERQGVMGDVQVAEENYVVCGALASRAHTGAQLASWFCCLLLTTADWACGLVAQLEVVPVIPAVPFVSPVNSRFSWPHVHKVDLV